MNKIVDSEIGLMESCQAQLRLPTKHHPSPRRGVVMRVNDVSYQQVENPSDGYR
jgi:hypothetical protein